jgi:glycosyltransferase involved in cell wall biosynthesis
MKIAIVIDELDMGGAQRIVQKIVTGINPDKYAVTVICTDGRFNSLLEKEMLVDSEGKYTIIFEKTRRPFVFRTKLKIFNKIMNRITRGIYDAARIVELCGILQQIKPDLIHAHQHGIWAAFWALPRGVPLITTLHTNPEAVFPRESEKFIFYITLLLKKNTLVAISEYNRARVESFFRFRNVRAINNGIEIETFYRKEHDTFTFINVSRQDVNKNQILIIRAFARLCQENAAVPVKLYLAGDGECHNALETECEKLNIADKVVFTGYVSSAREYLSVSDVYISSARREGLSLSVLEAMAAGLPVIAADTGGVRDLARENGILIEDNDEDALLAAMKRLRDNKTLCEDMGKKSREMARDYDVRVMREKYYSLYDEVVAKPVRNH